MTAENETDPAVTDALSDPIMADPRLALQGNGGSISVPVDIDNGDHAFTLGQVATARRSEPAFRNCDANVDYAFAWMARLPAEIGLPDGAIISEAAGRDSATCKLRIVRYAIARSAAAVETYYRKTGFRVTINDGIMTGVRATDGAAFWVSVKSTNRGSAVDFVTNRGR